RLLHRAELLVELPTRRMLWVAADLVENPLELGDELVVDLLVDETRKPPRAPRADLQSDLELALVELLAAELDELVDQPLPVIAGDRDVEQRRQRLVAGNMPQGISESGLRGFAQLRVVHGTQHPVERDGGVAAQGSRVILPAQPRAEARDEIGADEPSGNRLARQEMVADEARERAPDLVLSRRDDRRVRYLEPERMLEQRGDRAPVREAADHRRLGERFDDAEERILLAQQACRAE